MTGYQYKGTYNGPRSGVYARDTLVCRRSPSGYHQNPTKHFSTIEGMFYATCKHCLQTVARAGNGNWLLAKDLKPTIIIEEHPFI